MVEAAENKAGFSVTHYPFYFSQNQTHICTWTGKIFLRTTEGCKIAKQEYKGNVRKTSSKMSNLSLDAYDVFGFHPMWVDIN
jgi:hypothetical protein